MKKGLFLFLSLCLLGFSSPIQDHCLDPEALHELASFFGIRDNLITETQKQWLRKPGQERWEIAELSSDERSFVLNWAKAQGFFDPWQTSYAKYDKALILGATTSRMQTRLDHLKDLWNEGIRFSEIVWLTGDRPLDKRVDELTDRTSNESEAARLIWQEADLPEEMRSLPILFIAVPMKADGKRPNTEDTIIAWLKVNPEPCSALFVSDQPFCGYQFAIIKSSLPEAIQFDVVGRGIESVAHPAAAAIILDTVARWAYQESLQCDGASCPIQRSQ